MSTERRHLVLATDQRFLVPTATTLRSLSLVDTGPITAWILVSGVDADSRGLVEESIEGTGVRVDWVDVDVRKLNGADGGQLGPAANYRLMIGEALPTDVRRVLYLDSDVLIEDSLEPLWDCEDPQAVVHAVRSVHYPWVCTYGAVDSWPELGLDPRKPYFNSGVLLIDLERWRDLDVGRQALDYLASPLANGTLADQEALNVVLAGSWSELHPRWNQQTPLLDRNRGVEAVYPDDVIEEARLHPAIVHFLSRPKPWQTGCTHPAAERWRHVAGGTAFAPVSLERVQWRDAMRWRVKRAGSALLKGR